MVNLDESTMDFQDRIRLRRLAVRLELRPLAAELGIAHTTLFRYETGEMKPRHLLDFETRHGKAIERLVKV